MARAEHQIQTKADILPQQNSEGARFAGLSGHAPEMSRLRRGSVQSVLVFIDGTICDDRQRLHLLGTPDFCKREEILKGRRQACICELPNKVASVVS
jgi:hypothetical protein